MRRQALSVLRCPSCHVGGLVPEADVAGESFAFGPARCERCGARYPVHEGLLDLVREAPRTSTAQRLMELPWVARAWERSVRGAVGVVLTGGRVDEDSELALVRGFLGTPGGPVVDLGCGAGGLVRTFSKQLAQGGVIGVDLSKPMLEEAIAQVREDGVAADFVRCAVPPLPFRDATLGAIVSTGFLHFLPDLASLLAEAFRALVPGGRLVASTYWAGPVGRLVHHRAGLFPRDEEALREAATVAGFVRFERVRVAPFITWKAERPGPR